jgi:hypothetical protein
MIKVFNLPSEEVNIEMITVACEETMGTPPCFIVHIDRADLDAGQQATYDNFIGLFGGTYEDEISNTVQMMSIDRATSSALVEGKTDKDYSVDFDATQQGYVDAFLQLIIDLKNAE